MMFHIVLPEANELQEQCDAMQAETECLRVAG